MTIGELYRQTDDVYHRILFLPLRACIEYISQVLNDEINNDKQKYFIDSIEKKHMIFNYKKFAKFGAQKEEAKIEEFYKMKHILNG